MTMRTGIPQLFIVFTILFICSVYCRTDRNDLFQIINGGMKSCSVQMFNVNELDCDKPVQNGQVQSGVSCTFRDNEGNSRHILCLSGDFKKLKVREKRAKDPNDMENSVKVGGAIGGAIGAGIGGPVGGAIGSVVGGVAGALLCWAFCKNVEPPKPNKPPSVTCGQPKPSNTITAGRGQTSVKVTWDYPSYNDPEGDPISISGGTPASGSLFGQGQHRIIYRATDSHGNMAVCDISFRVTVNYCRKDLYVKNGRAICDRSDKVFGTVCTFECNDGYELTSDSVTSKECEGTDFTAGKVECIKKRCSMPDPVCNGNFTCTNDLYEFDTVCYPKCNDGYETDPNRYLKCNGKDWDGKNTILDCEDAQPPEFVNCPASITRFADKGTTVAKNVTWNIPTAIDNSQQGQVCGGTSTVTVEQTNGQTIGTDFDEGYHVVNYKATDSKGLTATCSFTVIVEVISCEPLQPSDNFLYFSCPDGYSYGSSCSFSCFLSYVLRGGENVTCELDSSGQHGKWEWTNDTQSYCEKLMCPELPAPANGALACSTVLGNQICTMSCNEKFQPPLKPPSEFVCNDDQEWIQGIPPNCTKRRNPNLSVLPGELVYFFSGDCNDAAVQEGIKNHFITVMEDLAYNRNWSNICPTFCNISNVNVKCGPVTGRRRREGVMDHLIIKRSTNKITINVDLTMGWLENGDYWQNDEKIIPIGEEITTMAANGKFTFNGIKPVATFQAYSAIGCEEGSVPDYYTETCSGCAPGTYLATDKCAECAKGFYEENEYSSACSPCPTGYSTERTGSSSVFDCKEICRPGTYSNTGVKSCSPCSIGEYQILEGATSCQKCQLGKFTQSVGATSESQCTDFDVTIASNATVVLNPISTSSADFALGLWILCSEACDSLMSLQMTTFTFNVGNDFQIANAGEISVQTLTEFKTKLWTQVIFVWTNSTRKMDVYLNGNVVLTKTLSTGIKGSLSVGDKLEIKPANRDAILSGLSLTGDITSDVFAKTCTPNVSHAIYTMSDFIAVSNSDIQMSQSQCDEQNECLSHPCGEENHCINKRGGYECACLGGFGGPNCQTPPDFCTRNNCTNGATCQSLNSNYTCYCASGYKGPFCETLIVNGGWSTWLEWSECSVLCDGGIKTRIRTCDNPPPDEDGAACIGSETESSFCNTDSCPECPSEYTLYNFKNVFNCSESGDYKSCTVTCENGYVFVNDYPPLDRYECGRNTSYKWTARPPSCTNVRGPPYLSTRLQLQYDNVPCSSADDLVSNIESNLQGLTCIQNRDCQTSVSVNGCAGGTRRRRSTSNLELFVTLFSSLNENAQLDLDDFYASNIVSSELATLINTYTDLAVSTFELTNNTNFTTVDVNGVVYTTDLSTINFTSTVNCSAGSVEYQSMCADCPTGTYWNNGLCILCPVGTYQDESRQLQCIQCPTGYSTLYTASRNATDCSVFVSTISEQSTSTEMYSRSSSQGNEQDTSPITSTTSSSGNAQDSSISTSATSSPANLRNSSTSTLATSPLGNSQDSSISTSTTSSPGISQDSSTSTSNTSSLGNSQDSSTSTSATSSPGTSRDISTSTSNSASLGNSQDSSTSTLNSASPGNSQDSSTSTSTTSTPENAQDITTSTSTTSTSGNSRDISTKTSTISSPGNSQDSLKNELVLLIPLIISAVLLGMIIMALIVIIKYKHQQRLKARRHLKASFASLNMVHPVIDSFLHSKVIPPVDS